LVIFGIIAGRQEGYTPNARVVILKETARHTESAANPMTHVTLQLRPETEQKLREKAGRHGQTLESYLQQLAEHDAGESNSTGPVGTSGPPLSEAEFERLLDELSEGPTLPRLPGDFSRADIYADHD
jgi:hypothetical protein